MSQLILYLLFQRLTAIKDKDLRSCFVTDYDPQWNLYKSEKESIYRKKVRNAGVALFPGLAGADSEGGVVQSNALFTQKFHFHGKLLDTFDKFGIPYLP